MKYFLPLIITFSIFINPTQFNNENDFNSYPKTIDEDISKLENIGCNALFLPDIQEIYPKGLAKKKIVNNLKFQPFFNFG